jgi:cell division protease FtsH
MKAYAVFPRHITDQSQRQKHKSFMSLSRFLRRAMIVRALRDEREFRCGQPGRFILLVPPNFEPKTMVSAARRALSECKPDLQDLYEYDVDPVDAETSPLWLNDLPVRLMEMPRYLLLTQSLEFIPHRCRLGFDAVLQMHPPTPAHWRAALKVCLGLAATDGEIDRIARLPIDLVALATGRRKSVTEIIDEVEAAIAEDDAKEARSKEPSAPSRQPRAMTLQELAGYGPAQTWGLDLASDLAAWKAGELAWADVDRGVLLCGPPGTGKTTFAAALAKSCEAHLVAASVARWQATGHLGDLLKAMRKAFSEARKNAPSILFIDEFDSIGDRAKFSDHHASYSIQVVNGLLECIDGLDDREGVVIVGACNNSDGIDPALLRPGRLDRQIDIPLPDETARRAILRVHQPDALDDDVIEKVAPVTDGWSGADLEALCRRSRRRARKERRAVTLDDFMAELPVEIAVPDDLVEVMAIHEAGHAVVASALGRGVEMIEINRTIRRDHAGPGGHVTIEQQPLKRQSRASYLEEVTILMAGIAAETVFYGEHADGAGAVRGSDLQRSTDLATIMETSMGFGTSLVYHDAQDAYSLDRLRRSDLKLKGRIDSILKSCLKTATDMISADRQAVEAIAKHLTKHGAMSGQQVRTMMERKRTSTKRRAVTQTTNVA